MNRSLRSLTTTWLLGVILAGSAGAQLKVTLLGTGCPPPVMNRFGPSTLVEAGDQNSCSTRGAARCSGSRN